MASHKALKGVVNNLSESFCSLMNYVDDDYVMGHIVRAAWATGASELRIDMLARTVIPSPLASPPVLKSLNYFWDDFSALLSRSNSSIDFVASAELIVTVDPAKRRPHDAGRFHESPFTCTARIVDDRGKLYEHAFSDWWYPEGGESAGIEQAHRADDAR